MMKLSYSSLPDSCAFKLSLNGRVFRLFNDPLFSQLFFKSRQDITQENNKQIMLGVQKCQEPTEHPNNCYACFAF